MAKLINFLRYSIYTVNFKQYSLNRLDTVLKRAFESFRAQNVLWYYNLPRYDGVSTASKRVILT